MAKRTRKQVIMAAVVILAAAGLGWTAISLRANYIRAQRPYADIVIVVDQSGTGCYQGPPWYAQPFVRFLSNERLENWPFHQEFWAASSSLPFAWLLYKGKYRNNFNARGLTQYWPFYFADSKRLLVGKLICENGKSKFKQCFMNSANGRITMANGWPEGWLTIIPAPDYSSRFYFWARPEFWNNIDTGLKIYGYNSGENAPKSLFFGLERQPGSSQAHISEFACGDYLYVMGNLDGKDKSVQLAVYGVRNQQLLSKHYVWDSIDSLDSPLTLSDHPQQLGLHSKYVIEGLRLQAVRPSVDERKALFCLSFSIRNIGREYISYSSYLFEMNPISGDISKFQLLPETKSFWPSDPGSVNIISTEYDSTYDRTYVLASARTNSGAGLGSTRLFCIYGDGRCNLIACDAVDPMCAASDGSLWFVTLTGEGILDQFWHVNRYDAIHKDIRVVMSVRPMNGRVRDIYAAPPN